MDWGGRGVSRRQESADIAGDGDPAVESRCVAAGVREMGIRVREWGASDGERMRLPAHRTAVETRDVGSW